jgi:hypothetical protein
MTATQETEEDMTILSDEVLVGDGLGKFLVARIDQAGGSLYHVYWLSGFERGVGDRLRLVASTC